MKRKLTVPEQHQLKIARRTLKLGRQMITVLGGPSREEARRIIERLTGERE